MAQNAQKSLLSGVVAWFPFKGNHAPFQMKVMEKNGAQVTATLTPEVTHIVCEPTEKRSILTNALPAGKTLESYEIVTRAFMAECLRSGRLQDPDNFRPILLPLLPLSVPVAPSNPVSTPNASKSGSGASPLPPKRQKVEAVPTPPPAPSSAGPREASAPPAPESMEIETFSNDGDANVEKEPCVVERRGSEWVAVRGRLPRFTGGNTGLPWGAYGVWEEPYDLKAAEKTVKELYNFYNHVKTAAESDCDSDEDDEDEDEEGGQQSLGIGHSKRPPVAGAVALLNGVCSHVACSCLNVCIVNALEDAKQTYSQREKDVFKVRRLETAQWSVKAHPTPLRWPEDVDGLPRVKDKTADKIVEILEVGRVASKVDAVVDNERLQILVGLQRVWGAGRSVAEQWYAAGCRGLDDVRNAAAEERVKLTPMQKGGLKHFEDLQKRVPREVVAATERLMRCTVFDMLERHLGASDAERTYCKAAGSYCRGAMDSGDMDFLIVLPPSAADVHCTEFLKSLLGTLLGLEMLLDEMDPLGKEKCKGKSHWERHADRASWMGFCRPPGLGHVARIDVKVYAHEHLACAVNFFCNGMEFCRATRHWANSSTGCKALAQTMHPEATGIKVSDKCVVARKRVRKRTGTGKYKNLDVILSEPVAMETETQLFKFLSLSYVPSHMRFFHAAA